MLAGPEGERRLRLRLRHMTNEELALYYDSDLLLRLHSKKDLSDTRKMIARYLVTYLNGLPPSPESAKDFLSQFVNRKPRTLSRYAKMIKSFMKWYGKPLDIKIKIPKSLPSYTDDSDIEKLLKAIGNKSTHKGCIQRDLLMTELALKSGMRRGELANLAAGDIHADFLMVLSGKGDKDRLIPLTATLAKRLQNFTKNMEPNEKVFKLKGPSITMKIKQFARKAGLNDLHAHTLRHKFATTLLERGANIKVVQELLWHENLNTTQMYLSLMPSSKNDAIELLEHGKPNKCDHIPEGWEKLDPPKAVAIVMQKKTS
jgi:site-specific recombinase XerD